MWSKIVLKSVNRNQIYLKNKSGVKGVMINNFNLLNSVLYYCGADAVSRIFGQNNDKCVTQSLLSPTAKEF